ncbi:MAG TPA: CRISPR-associated endonuclease Cas2 [Bacteroidia bacterium]|nr:CRISPR-associated endonuclease Cas2 [Bacteroidia bacterium]
MLQSRCFFLKRSSFLIRYFFCLTLIIEALATTNIVFPNLLKNGFNMMQFSVYMRHCASSENTDVHEKRIQRLLPP